MSVVGSVELFLAGLGGGTVENDPLAASAVALAEILDDADNSATSRSMVAKELRETLACLRALAPPKEQEDDIERARKRRVERLTRQSASGASTPS